MTRHQQRQMIVDSLVQTEAFRQSVARGQVDSGALFSVSRGPDGFETRIHRHRLAKSTVEERGSIARSTPSATPSATPPATSPTATTYPTPATAPPPP